MSILSLDARWRRFNDPDYRSPLDGRAFSGVYDLGFDAPDAWPHAPLSEASPELVEVGEDRLSAELCRIGEERFLHAILALPIRGSEEVLFLAPWVQVAPADLHAYIDSLSGEAAFTEAPGMLANLLPGFEDEGLTTPLALHAGGAGERPQIEPLDGPLARARAEGISFDTLLDIYAAAGDDIRPHLAG